MFPESMTNIYPHPQSLSQRERDAKPFSHWEKGGDEGDKVIRDICLVFWQPQ